MVMNGSERLRPGTGNLTLPTLPGIQPRPAGAPPAPAQTIQAPTDQSTIRAGLNQTPDASGPANLVAFGTPTASMPQAGQASVSFPIPGVDGTEAPTRVPRPASVSSAGSLNTAPPEIVVARAEYTRNVNASQNRAFTRLMDYMSREGMIDLPTPAEDLTPQQSGDKWFRASEAVTALGAQIMVAAQTDDNLSDAELISIFKLPENPTKDQLVEARMVAQSTLQIGIGANQTPEADAAFGAFEHIVRENGRTGEPLSENAINELHDRALDVVKTAGDPALSPGAMSEFRASIDRILPESDRQYATIRAGALRLFDETLAAGAASREAEETIPRRASTPTLETITLASAPQTDLSGLLQNLPTPQQIRMEPLPANNGDAPQNETEEPLRLANGTVLPPGFGPDMLREGMIRGAEMQAGRPVSSQELRRTAAVASIDNLRQAAQTVRSAPPEQRARLSRILDTHLTPRLQERGKLNQARVKFAQIAHRAMDNFMAKMRTAREAALTQPANPETEARQTELQNLLTSVDALASKLELVAKPFFEGAEKIREEYEAMLEEAHLSFSNLARQQTENQDSHVQVDTQQVRKLKESLDYHMDKLNEGSELSRGQLKQWLESSLQQIREQLAQS